MLQDYYEKYFLASRFFGQFSFIYFASSFHHVIKKDSFILFYFSDFSIRY